MSAEHVFREGHERCLDVQLATGLGKDNDVLGEVCDVCCVVGPADGTTLLVPADHYDMASNDHGVYGLAHISWKTQKRGVARISCGAMVELDHEVKVLMWDWSHMRAVESLTESRFGTLDLPREAVSSDILIVWIRG